MAQRLLSVGGMKTFACSYRSLFLAVPLSLLSVACTGMTFGENQPGGDTQLDPNLGETEYNADLGTYYRHAVGDPAVERDEDRAWVVHTESLTTGVTSTGSSNGKITSRSHLAAVQPDGTATNVIETTDAYDVRIVFPRNDRALVMAEKDGHEKLALLDTNTNTKLRSKSTKVRYWGTRTAPSGKFLVVCDANGKPIVDPVTKAEKTICPLHLIDTDTLEKAENAIGGAHGIEAMWNHKGDQLLALTVDEPTTDHPVARIHRWDVTNLAGWKQPALTVDVPGYRWDFLFSFTWIATSPDDRWAVFPLVNATTKAYELIVLDQQDGTTRVVPGKGPVGFTPDNSTIVSYGESDNGALLYLIDVATLATRTELTPIKGLLSYFVTWSGNYVVVASALGSEALQIYDPQTGEATKVNGAAIDLNDFVTRPGRDQLWLESNASLYRLALDKAVLQKMPLDFDVGGINIMPIKDTLVLTKAKTAAVVFYDLETETVTTTAPLPSSLSSPVKLTLD